MNNNPQVIQAHDWIVRYRAPASDGAAPVLLLLHGWTGDENSMWVFGRRFPESCLVLAPRGRYTSAAGGYGWHPELRRWPTIADFDRAANELVDLVDNILPGHLDLPQADYSRVSVAGFSQGAALAYALALLFPGRIHRLAGLSGFMPAGHELLVSRRQLTGIPAFIAHGTHDKIVPIEMARTAAEALELAGAQVVYCEDEVGHKLSASCFRGLEAFLSERVC